jgi:5-methylcytosine-specific restriction endonuclease McrA
VSPVLLLNATYEPLALLSLRRAAKLLLKERAEPVSTRSLDLAGSDITIPVPSVMRLKYYVYIPYRRLPAWTRKGLLARDRSTCAYCGRRCSTQEATVDHVLPVSRGGRSTWENTVVACFPCNQRKADRTPAEAGMPLLIEPVAPRSLPVRELSYYQAGGIW